jgi:malonate-semialdehyde dehydrogenase (acetylating)/methylmalonate-semialdehyde dehydrogenase
LTGVAPKPSRVVPAGRTGQKEKRVQTINHWIGGRSVPGPDDGYGAVFDPATGEQAGQVDLADANRVDEAVATAQAAFAGWQDNSLARRTRVLFAFRDLVYRHRDDFARLITSEHGKTLDDARGEVQRGLEVIEFACGVPHLIKGDYSEGVSTNIDAHSLRQPLGVVAGITPFNFPVMVPMWMYPLAIACGNTFVLKPSEKDPSSSVLVAKLWSEAGLPDGVFNVVHGAKAAVDAILDNADIASVSFVGSTPIARYVYERGTASGKRVQALGGAKNHMVVLPDADLDVAADAAVSAGYGSAGERCMAISAVVAVGSIGDRLVEAIRQRTLKVNTGAGADEGVEMGPLVTRAHRDKVATYVEAGLVAGAKLVVDGRDCQVPGHDKGFFLGPCLFDEVTPDMTIYTDEIFGPVLSVLRVDDYDQALALVNSNRYGNGVALFTNDGLAARRFEREVQVGMVGINVPIPTPMAYYSFGGWKQSLFGDTHVYGMHGIHFYTRTKAVTVRWPAPGAKRAINLGFPIAY